MTAKILLVDDNTVQCKLSRAYLEDAGYVVTTAANANEALQAAKDVRPDVILSDVMMGEIDGFGLCRRLRDDASLARIPVILVSAHYGGAENRALARDVGASTLIERSPEHLHELAAIRECLAAGTRRHPITQNTYEQHLRSNAVQLMKLQDQARRAELRARALFDNANDVISVLTPEGVVIEANPAWEALIGIPSEQLVGMHVRDFASGPNAEQNADAYRDATSQRTGHKIAPLNHAITGATVYVDFSTSVVEVDGTPQVIAIGRDVTANVEASRRIAAAEAMYRSLVERLPDVVLRFDATGEALFVSPNIEKITGYSPAWLVADGAAAWIALVHPEDVARVRATFAKMLDEQTAYSHEYRLRTRDGRWIWLHSRFEVTRDGDAMFFDGLISDITERRVLEQSLAQAQKMEAIGQLSAGIAHDFNNLLAVIMANAGFLVDDLGESDPRRADAKEIEAAAERAASLTRQLLAFSRRQVLEPTVVDLNSVVQGLGKMLPRLISEDVEIAYALGSDLGSVRADVGQIEQVIMNLAVNARDAMPTGGKLTIETANVEISERQFDGLPAGRYAMLAVSDNGCGMDSETKQRIFEPFFTTKERGRGTGLGLSTCYGIVKQSEGHISVYSELGVGTVFKVLLPRTDAAPAPARVIDHQLAAQGNQTILVIEDEDQVRRSIARTLESRGYRTFAAAGPDEAVVLARTAPRIDLIISDVVMPGRSGNFESVRAALPDARLLLMSGYTDHALLRDGVFSGAVNFLQKPFAAEALVRKIRDILES